ncbi:translation initiation factor IF-2 [Actinomadura sp. KC216]|uniref:translation initiation factor IF-2 n=1 Tax=Actinomadura sp. KC216 TaxID=2530370 RepID=UPI001042CE05|nr:translation initiation factor IF-2 [Actinomadura sp. KC216]TDB80338.1 translation initiation factor IF-2 [Actinomadura sp. KC216]
MRRIAIVLVGLLVTGCVPGTSPEDEATDDAREKARRVKNVVYGGRTWSAQDVGHLAADLGKVDVMRVRGVSTGTGDGVRVVVRTSGSAFEDWGNEITVRRCFELRFKGDAERDDDPREVPCPQGEPLTFKPWPKTPDIPSGRLERALPRVPAGGAAEEAKVRAAVASLRLDPAIRVEFMTQGGVVGVVLKVKPYLSEAFDCVLARIAPGRTSVWSPSRIQRMPGEGGCSAGNAIDPMPPPH